MSKDALLQAIPCPKCRRTATFIDIEHIEETEPVEIECGVCGHKFTVEVTIDEYEGKLSDLESDTQ